MQAEICKGAEMNEQTITQKMRGRPVTHEEARDSSRRLINSHFRNPDQARIQIPVSASDDDVLILDYILEQEERK
jgi:hypothetical protein